MYNLDATQNEVEKSKFTLHFPLRDLVSIEFSMEDNLKKLKDELANSNVDTQRKNISSVEFFTLNGSRIPEPEKIKDNKEFPILCRINNERIFSINFDPEMHLQGRDKTTMKDQEEYFDMAEGLGLYAYQSRALSQVCHRVQRGLPNNKKEFTGDELLKQLDFYLKYLQGKDTHQTDKSIFYGNDKYFRETITSKIEELAVKISEVE